MPTAHTGEFFELLRLGHATSVTLVCIVVNRLCLPTTSTRHPRAHPPVQWLSSRNIPTLPAHRSPPRLHPRFGSSRRCSRYYEVLRSEIRTHSHRLPGCCSPPPPPRLCDMTPPSIPNTLTPRARPSSLLRTARRLLRYRWVMTDQLGMCSFDLTMFERETVVMREPPTCRRGASGRGCLGHATSTRANVVDPCIRCIADSNNIFLPLELWRELVCHFIYSYTGNPSPVVDFFALTRTRVNVQPQFRRAKVSRHPSLDTLACLETLVTLVCPNTPARRDVGH